MSAIKIPTVDLSAYFSPTSTPSSRASAASSLVSALHSLGFVAITNVSLTPSEISSAFSISKILFALPHSEKMKAPHPAAAVPHRGYSAPGVEKVYSNSDVSAADNDTSSDNGRAAIREVEDYKESYEIGADDDPDQPPIWLPEGVLPGFRESMTEFYWKLNGVGNVLLEAIADGLRLDGEERRLLLESNSQNQNQLRLLHYPEVDRDRLHAKVLARMPEHTDWGACTMLWQDGVGGLEMKDPRSGEWVRAVPEEGACVVNTGDFMEGLTNGYFKSATHRVTLPPTKADGGTLAERYSIPYFIAPKLNKLRQPLPTFVTEETPSNYKTMTFGEYATWRARYSY